MWPIARSLVPVAIDNYAIRLLHGVGERRLISSHSRKRRSAYRKALADPDTHPGTLKKLREGAARPSHDLLRNLAEEKIHKAVTTADRRNLWFTLQFKRYAPMFLGQMKPRMNFWTAALDESQLPLPQLPEVAIAGRSNSGKSTLVNYLCGRHSAKVKREPGSTQELVFWRIGRPAQLCLVDLPGYGFAVASEEKRLQWTEFALWYLRSRRNLSRVLLLIDARQGLKPADKEMIAYLERHHVKWQIVVTKCDCVKAKDLARRLTVLEEDVASYIRMAGPPIPISALKRMGMERLREVLDRMKVQKDVVKDGIRQRVYDLLEQKRVQRAERSRVKREKRRQKQELEQAEAEKGQQMAAHGLDLQEEGAEEPETGKVRLETPTLHDLLNDAKNGEVGAESTRTDSTRARFDAAESPSQPLVPEARYSLTDRDSARVDGFMKSLFPSLPEMQSSSHAPTKTLTNDSIEGFPLMEKFPSTTEVNILSDFGHMGFGSTSRASHADGEDNDSDSDSDEVSRIRPSVLRFDPMPAYGGHVESYHTGSQDLGSFIPSKFPHEIPASQQVSLRPGWARAPSNQDRIYDRDDFASPQDIASGKRRFAPPAPDVATAGNLMSEARKRYEREWATELESIDGTQSSLAESEKASHLQSRGVTKLVSKMHQVAAVSAVKNAAVKESRPSYITKGGEKIITKGRASWRVVGRPPPTILKKKRTKDAAKQFNLSDRRGKKRNMGDGLTWAEAKQHWINWFRDNKGRKRNRPLQADSPKKEDVEAEFERRRQFPLRRRAQSDHSDPSKGPRVRTGPGGAAAGGAEDMM